MSWGILIESLDKRIRDQDKRIRQLEMNHDTYLTLLGQKIKSFEEVIRKLEAVLEAME